jgi:hypothetical protein
MLLFLNELSCAEPTSKELASDAMRDFVQLLRQIWGMRSDAALVSAVKREQLELAPGYYLQEWAGQAANRDHWRFIRTMQNRAPFSDVLPAGVGESIEYRWESRLAEALGAAHLMNGLLVSLLANECWRVPWVAATRSALLESGDGQVTVIDDEVQVRHAAVAQHVTVHDEWLKQVGVLDLTSGPQLWKQRAALFPNLQFLPRVEGLLGELRDYWVLSLARELRRIDDAIADWDPKVHPVPRWRSLITPEHENRKRLCEFTDLDDRTRTFDWHGRFPPGAGRVYFRLVPEERKARVAHVGLKLGI